MRVDLRVERIAKYVLVAFFIALAPSLARADAPETITGVNAAQLFVLAEQFEHENGSFAAERVYQALELDSNTDIRNEARFRHGQLLAARGEHAQAAALYRSILNEQPNAQRVRMELSVLLAQTGDMRGARRELRQVQSTGLPPDVARAVDQYAAALRSTRPFGASMELALAPSNNVNRATSAKTLDTVLAPFQLSDDARAHSGVGVRLGGQAFARAPLAQNLALVLRLSGEGNFYHDDDFDDVLGSAQFGLESRFGKTQVRPFVGRSYRWYGEELYATTDTGTLSIVQPMSQNDQITTDIGFGQARYKLNNLQDGPIYTASVLYEHAFSPRTGVGLGLSLERQDAKDPGYATTTRGGQLLAWSHFGDASVFANLQISRLEADERLSLFPDRREEWRISPTLGATLPHLKVFGFAPVVRLSYERNKSTIGIYDYSRVALDLGLSKEF